MKVAVINLPWESPEDKMLWGVRAGSRWPHFQQRPEPDKLPRYIPFPFFSAIAAAIIQDNGHEVILIDAVAEDLSLDKLTGRLYDFAPELLFAETATPCFDHDMTMLKKLRESVGIKYIGSGGMHPVELLTDDLPIDFWIPGEFENKLAECVNTLNNSKSVQKILPAQKIADLDSLPKPLFEQLPIQNYSDPVCGLPAPVANSWISRGCPFGCTFCVWPQLVYGDRKYRRRSIDLALDEIEIMINQHGCESFYFDDDTTNIGTERMVELAEKIIARGLDKYPWSMMARPDCMSEEALYALKKAGLYSIKYGVESASEKLLNACEKGTDFAKLQECLKITAELNIKMHLTFTFGVPGETSETIHETYNFAERIAPETAQFSICTPFPGTKYYQECLNNGWLIETDYKKFLGSSNAVVSTPWLTAEELTTEYKIVLDKWQTFIKNRHKQRIKKLNNWLTDQVKSGKKWQLHGDREFAGTIITAEDIWKSEVKNSGEINIILSRYDEQKILARLQRAKLVDIKTTASLYNGVPD